MILAPPRFERTPHLVDLIADAERLAATITGTDADDPRRDLLHVDAALATLRLDGADLTVPPTPVDPAVPARGPTRPPDRRTGSWFEAMGRGTARAADVEDRVRWLEYRGARRGIAALDLAEDLLTRPRAALHDLYGRLTDGLVDARTVGALRSTEQAVHDASIGRVIYFPLDPARIAAGLDHLAGWLTSAAAREHALVVAGVVHHDLLRIHPFEAANGRLARTAARLLLTARGLDPDGLGSYEAALEHDPIGYHEEVARTIRRRDLTIWLERWGEAVTAGLRTTAHALGVPTERPGPRPLAFVDRLSDPAFTIADYRAATAADPQRARADLRSLLDARRIRRVPGSRGLRFTAT